jgi:tetratricopeptide (TPR) repeat protein
MLLSDFHTDHAQHHSTEALLDRAKALHEVGLKKESIAILDAISSRQEESADELNLMATYLKQEKEEKEAITLSPKTLNNTAVAQYKRGNLEQSYTTFAQVFRVMPKNPSIALNYLQAIIRAKKANAPMLSDTVAAINKCRETLEITTLSEDQNARYQSVKNILKNK